MSLTPVTHHQSGNEMSAEQLPAPHIRWVFAGQMLRAGLMSWAEFEAETILIFGPDFGPAITDRGRRAAIGGGQGLRRRDRAVPRRL